MSPRPLKSESATVYEQSRIGAEYFDLSCLPGQQMSAIYDTIGLEYDTTRRADPTIVSQLAALLEIDRSKRYIDIACGTGNYTVKLADLGGEWSAFDQSQEMLLEAKQKSAVIAWQQGDVASTGYESASFDAAVCTLAIHHFLDLNAAFSEVARILKPSGRFLLFTATPEQMQSYWLNHYFPEMMQCSIAQMPRLVSIESALAKAKMSVEEAKPFFITPELQDFFLYSGKQRPEMYLSAAVRNGISSFHQYCSEQELASGLDKLRKDIETGAINAVMNSYNSDFGDYLFLCAHAD